MVLNEQTVSAFREVLTNPQAHGFNFKSLSEIFEKSTEPTPKHVLFEKYTALIDRDIPKVIFYILMDELFEVKKCTNKDLGYCASFYSCL